MSLDTHTDGEMADNDAEVEATLRGYPALLPGAEVPATVEVRNLDWSTIYDNFGPARDGFLTLAPPVREAVQDEVENAGYELLGLAGFELDVDTSDERHEIILDVVLTGKGEADEADV